MSSSKINQSSSSRLLTLEPINIMAFTMTLSLVWAVAVIIFGCIVRFFTASLLDGLAEASANKTLTKNAAGQDICPLLTEVKDMPDVGDWLLVLGSVLLSAGSLTFIYSVLGFFAAVKECKLCIAVEIVLIFITIALMIYVVQIIYNPFFGFHEIAKNQLTTKLIEDYTIESDNSGFTALMNSIMILKECCGIRGAADFRNLTFYEKTFVYPDPYFFNLPPACCKPTFFKGDSDRQIFTKLLACAQRGLSEPRSINLKGCYDEVFKHVQALHGGWMSTIFILMILLSTDRDNQKKCQSDRDNQRDGQTETTRETVRQRQPERRSDRQRQPEKVSVRQRQPERRSDRDNQRDGQTETTRETVRQRQPERRSDRQRQPERVSVIQRPPERRSDRQRQPERRSDRQRQPEKVSVIQRPPERRSDRDNQRDGQTDRDNQRDGQTETTRETVSQTETTRKSVSHTETTRETVRQRQPERRSDTQRQPERRSDRQRQPERRSDRQRQQERRSDTQRQPERRSDRQRQQERRSQTDNQRDGQTDKDNQKKCQSDRDNQRTVRQNGDRMTVRSTERQSDGRPVDG
ncbi:hypothetical protein Btru_063285 [Bulinus truncatus]|nr:hypothetical protein Btru_063285 [Bulinus truncatus]